MPPAGIELQAIWREAGEWWDGASQREFVRFIDANGVRRENLREMPCITQLKHEVPTAKIPHVRDDKVAYANGHVPDFDLTFYQQHYDPQGVAALHIQSGYAFGRSTIAAAEIPILDSALKYSAILLADPFSLVGAVEFEKNAKSVGQQALIGSTFEMDEGGELVLVARNANGYRNLSRLITDCHLHERRLYPLCTKDRLKRHTADLVCLTGGDSGPINRFLIKGDEESARQYLEFLAHLYGRVNVFIQIERSFLPWEVGVNRRLLLLAEELGMIAVAGGPTTHRVLADFPAQDAMVCVESLCTIEEVDGRKPRRDPSQSQISYLPRRALNAERYLRYPSQLMKLFADHPELVRNTMKVAQRCERNVLPEPTKLPRIVDDEAARLRFLTYEGARHSFGRITTEQKSRIEIELNRLSHNEFAGHFLIAHDMCRWAGDQGIIYSGRGSIVDSFVAYCLNITRINALKYNLHFDRFLPAEGRKRPDIDIDFEAKRRDDVRDYLVRKYGKDHVATVAAIGTYGTRGIIREVGKVMGIPQEDLGYLIKRLHGSVSPDRLEREIERKPELRNSNIPRERFHWVFRLASLMMNLPRNLRSHSSGVVISRDPVCDTVPVTHSAVEGVNIIQWDKRSAKHFFDKFDVLCLRGNDVLGDLQERIRVNSPDFSIVKLDIEDQHAFSAMRAGELIGIPQSASPAMRQAHIRLQTKTFHDAGIVQAAIRPGVGGAVKLNELIQRRKTGDYRPRFEELAPILTPTYGIIVFQEQVDLLLQGFGGYTSDEAEDIRDSIYKKRHSEFIAKLKESVIDRIVCRNHSRELAEEVYSLVSQFQGYGFAEGHALAFADISIRSIHCQQNYPAPFFAALLDAQPAGYYGPCTLVNEARNRGVPILPPCVNHSDLKYKVEDHKSDMDPHITSPQTAIRVSLTQIRGLSKQTRQEIVSRRQDCPYESFFDFVARVRPAKDELENLTLCGAFDGLNTNRRELLWSIPSAIRYGNLRQASELPFARIRVQSKEDFEQNLLSSVSTSANLQTPNHSAETQALNSSLPLIIPAPNFPQGIVDFIPGEKAHFEREYLDLDVKQHLMAFERERIQSKGGLTAAQTSKLPDRTQCFVVGNPIRLRFPPTSSGKRVMFFDLEDETGLLNVTCFNETYLKYGHAVICNPYITLFGEAQHRDGHVAFMASRILPYKPVLQIPEGKQEQLFAIADFLMT